ncbi:MAG: EpsI family protein [Candidatus Hydrogenedentes bacterium]|nr:EpsI family protein [Candidatus Hydrogenedentota bacterium]
MKHYVITLVLLAAASAGHFSFLAAQEEDVVKKDAVMQTLDMPEQIGAYRALGNQVGVDAHTVDVLQTSTIFVRNYLSPRGAPVQLTIVYAGTTRRSLHFPEVCLVGDGWDIQEQAPYPVGILFTAKRLVLAKGNQTEAVLYWFKTGDDFTGNFFLNAMDWAMEQFTRGAPTSSMIKLTMRVGPQGREAAFATLEDFAEKLTPIVRDRIK